MELVIEKGERPIDALGLEPQRELGELDRCRVLVDTEEAELGDESLCMNERFAVRFGDRRELAIAFPGLHNLLAEISAHLEQECTGAYRRIANLETENLMRSWFADTAQKRLERLSHEWLGELARRVLAPGAAPRTGRLKHDLSRSRAASNRVRLAEAFRDRVRCFVVVGFGE